ncbi:MAG: TetR/AcrR family transcriptional regulator [Clostridiales bacterium]|nr:TetR/AcrR family transcriptional regulator [Lachnospiraceae bacterium]MCD8214307.1 TetR/AcrR family transcriptional regulator [Clostridiales bacterium]
MPKGSPELTNARREEIINACEELYKTMGFKEITIKEIGSITSFTRTSIYNYFQTKEEIFLALLQREYKLWIDDLKEMMAKYEAMTTDEFADKLACSLEKRPQMLKIMSMNHYDMESGSRLEHLTQFKVVFGETMNTVMLCLDQYFPYMTAADKESFIYAFFPFMFGIYPYTVVNEKQRTAMEKANVNYVFMTIYEIANRFIKSILKK